MTGKKDTSFCGSGDDLHVGLGADCLEMTAVNGSNWRRTTFRWIVAMSK